jgi:hypothetical protein
LAADQAVGVVVGGIAMKFNVYCDESGHLENDHIPTMLLGAIWCPSEQTRQIAIDIRQIKRAHGLSSTFEIKWTKVSPAQIAFYVNLLEYFFTNSDLHFRALIVPEKSILNHPLHNQNHDDFYYKMYFDMLKTILAPHDQYRIYLDIKDTRSASKVEKLGVILRNNMYDFSREVVENIQTVRSHEVEQIQLADFLIGIVSYANRNLATSPAKLQLVERMRRLSGYKLTQTTLLRENKVNVFRWHPREN